MNQTRSNKIAFIQASWHAELVQRAHAGFVAEIEKQGLSAADVETFTVPGSLELPLQAQRLARTGGYAIIVCAGLVVDGGIYRHEFVAQTVLDGLMRVQLDADVPVLSIVLTPHEFRDSEVHRQFFHGHLFTKGQEAASACLQILRPAQKLPKVASAGAGHG